MTIRPSFLSVSAALALVLTFSSDAQAQDFMTQKELLATFPGSTLSGISNTDGKTPWAQAYSTGRKKGKIAGNYGGSKYDAKWYVEGDQWCEDWGSGSGCWQVVQTGEKEFEMYKDGKPLKNRWKMK